MRIGESRRWSQANRSLRTLHGHGRKVVAVKVTMLVEVDEGNSWGTFTRAELVAKNAVSDITLGQRFVGEVDGSVLDVEVSDIVSASKGEQTSRRLDSDSARELHLKRAHLWETEQADQQRRAQR